MDDSRLAHGGEPVGHAAGGLLDALHADRLGEALGAVPASGDAAGNDADFGRHPAGWPAHGEGPRYPLNPPLSRPTLPSSVTSASSTRARRRGHTSPRDCRAIRVPQRGVVNSGHLGGWCFSRKVTKRTDDQGVYQCVSLYVISVFLAQRRLAPAS